MEKIELIGVNKSFKEEKVLKDICLTLTDDKIYGFVGRNGSGKSVLFKIICGYVIADSGKIMIDGKELGKDIDFPEELGALIETPGFIWYQSGFENLRYLARIRNKISDSQVKDAIRQVGLNPDSKKWVGKYSMGMKQRLGIAQALLNRPKILVLDEPTAGLDPKERVRFRRLLERLGKESIVLLSTHIVSDLERIADRILLMQDGRLTFDGPLESVGEQLEEFYLEKFGEDDL